VSELKQIWSCGGGANSVAIAALIIQGRLPKPDLSVISDTGLEAKTTWAYLETVLDPALAKVGIKIERIKASEWSYYHKTGHEIFNSQGTIQIPVYTDQSGEISKLPGYCSTAWKQEPVDRWLRSLGVSKNESRIWIGFGKDEQRRWAKKIITQDYKRGLVRLPLVEDVPLNRHGCQNLITVEMGWPEAPKSRCWMCPNQNDKEWLELTPEERRAANEFDVEIRKRDPNAWLHRSCKPLSEVDFTKIDEPDLFSRPCDSGVCFL
jgi:hypothetical protein